MGFLNTGNQLGDILRVSMSHSPGELFHLSIGQTRPMAEAVDSLAALAALTPGRADLGGPGLLPGEAGPRGEEIGEIHASIDSNQPTWLWVKTSGIPFWGRCSTHFSLF